LGWRVRRNANLAKSEADKNEKALQGEAMDKAALQKAIMSGLEAELQLMTEAAHTARDEATNEESRAEDRFDMRSQSAAYLAAGQAKMAGETADALKVYRNLILRSFSPSDPIASSALVTLEAGSRKSHYFIGPMRGGLEVSLAGKRVTVVTAASPLGRQLVGRRVGDQVILPGRPKPIAHMVVAVE
jgi:transcription elongation GreA/GreB family factor